MLSFLIALETSKYAIFFDSTGHLEWDKFWFAIWMTV